jgi:CPA2 family monovalent cation:H+ antiporter-2
MKDFKLENHIRKSELNYWELPIDDKFGEGLELVNEFGTPAFSWVSREKKPEYAGRLLSRDLHLTDFEIPGESAWVGRTLAELNFGKKYGIHVVSILRGKKRINIPGASVRLFPQDKIQVIATDEELNIFGKEMDKVSAMNTDVIEKSEMILRQFCVDGQSPFLNKTLKEAGIREKYHCLIAGVERGGETLHAPDPHEPFVEGDVVWVVGESADVYELVSQKGEGFDMEV